MLVIDEGGKGIEKKVAGSLPFMVLKGGLEILRKNIEKGD